MNLEETFWIPLYLYLLFIIYKKNQKTTLVIGLFIGLLFLIADQVSVLLFKEVFERLRPCHNPEIQPIVHTLYGKCGGQFGFISSHAANSFALAIFAGSMLKKYYKHILWMLLLWATLVSYSRIYAGVHYPADILVGIMLGTIVGLAVFQMMKLADRKFNLNIDTFK